MRVTLKIGLVTLGISLAFLSLEGGISLGNPQLSVNLGERARFCEFDPELGWRNKPGTNGTFSSGDFKTEVSINSLGFRDKIFISNKEPEITRIVALGDSFTWGFGVNEGERYTEVLERLQQNIEVLNMGCSGYGQDQELLTLNRFGQMYRPDLIIVFLDLFSDLENNSSSFQYGYQKPVFIEKNGDIVPANLPLLQPSLYDRIDNFLLYNTNTWNFIGRREIRQVPFNKILRSSFERLGLLQAVSEQRTNLTPTQITCRLASKIKNEGDALGAQVLFVIAPRIRFDSPSFLNFDPKINRALVDCIGSSGSHVLSLKDPFEAHFKNSPLSTLTFANDSHLNAAGHQLVAKEISRKISDLFSPSL